MGLLDLDIRGARNDFAQRIADPFTPAQVPDLKSAIERDDFRNGFNMIEIQNGRELTREAIQLRGSAMPHVPFTFGGEQRIVKDYYPGNSEPSVQVLGSRESDITIKGRMYSKRLATAGGNSESIRSFPQELQQKIEAMRIRGNVVRLYMGEFQRFGFIESASFDLKTLADIKYTINFSIIGFNAPRQCRITTRQRQVPFAINKELIDSVNNFQDEGLQIPSGIGMSLAGQIEANINRVAGQIALVTDYVDNVLNEADAIRQSVSRAQGLIQNARNSVTSLITTFGGFNPATNSELGSNPTGGVATQYRNNAFLQNTLANAFSMTAFLAQLRDLIAELSLTLPLARHRIQSGDTLQELATRFYGDVDQWSEIYDHNTLQTSDLEQLRGEVLEIPRIE